MCKVIMIGCDLHDGKMILKTAIDRQEPETTLADNTARGRKSLIAQLLNRAKTVGATRIVFAYEASGQGFGLPTNLLKPVSSVMYWRRRGSPDPCGSAARKPTSGTPCNCWSCCGPTFWPATACLRCGSRIAKPATTASWADAFGRGGEGNGVEDSGAKLAEAIPVASAGTAGKGWTVAFGNWLDAYWPIQCFRQVALWVVVAKRPCPVCCGNCVGLKKSKGSWTSRYVRWRNRRVMRRRSGS